MASYCFTCENYRHFINGQVVRDPNDPNGIKIEEIEYMEEFIECVEENCPPLIILRAGCEIGARDKRTKILKLPART